jgi:polyisoprenyl-phosphate glycosyltransferase
MGDRLAIITPVLDDWASFAMLVRHISDLYSNSGMSMLVLAIDDGSATSFDPGSLSLPEASCVVELFVLRLSASMGHQRAIAIGLSNIANRTDIDTVIVMDGDGEDRPEDIGSLRTAGLTHPGFAVLAERASRSEGLTFRLFYLAYRLLFRMLTGQTIKFGNFSLFPMTVVRRLVYMPELWNNLAAALMRSRLQFTTVPVHRGRRYAGKSKMNLPMLIVHGLSAMSVYIDVIFVRILLVGTLLAGLTALGMLIVVLIRLFTEFGVPGWASTMIGDLAIILVQSLTLMVATTLMVLATRSNRQIVPILDAPAFAIPASSPPHISTAKSASDHAASHESASL